MVSNKMFFFCCPKPLSMSSNNIFKGKGVLINSDTRKKSTKSSTKHCNSKKFCILQNASQNVLFFLHKFISRQFLYCPRVFTLTKILNTIPTPTEIKQNLTH